MSQEPSNLIESDHIEEVLDKAGPPPPVVVVEYRNRLMPWALVVALTGIVVGVLGMYARNRRDTERLSRQFLETRDDKERYRQQVLETRDDLEHLRERARAENSGPRPAPADRPADEKLAMAKSPTAAPAGERTVPAATAAGVSGRPQASDPPPSEKPQGPQPTVEKAPPSPTPDPAPKPVPVIVKADPAQSASAPATSSAAPPTPAPPPATTPRHRVVTLPGVPEASSPFDELAGAGGEAPKQEGLVALPAEPPLPSREETERQIRDEAARLQQQNNQRLTQQQEDLHTLQEEDRRQFREELRVTLQVHGPQAGPQIEELSLRAGRDENPVKLRLAHRVIGSGRQSQRMKVYQLRAIGVSESVILDYLANEFDKDRGGRNGPRSKEEVWIRAAQTLLRYEPLPPRPADAPPAGGRPAGGPAATRPTGDTSRAP
jgi:hypothetical protein